MSTFNINIPDSLGRDFELYAKRTDRDVSEVIHEALELYRKQRIRERSTHSIRDIQPAGLGAVLKQWANRSELAEDFFGQD